MIWTPRNPLRWGARQALPVVAGIAAQDITTQELVRVEGPAPTTWNLMGQVLGVAAGDLPPALLWQVQLELGLGSTTQLIVLPFTPASPWTAVLVPAQWLVVTVRVRGAVAVGGNWIFSAQAAPTTPWEGSQVSIGD